jgi:DNA-binding GntR family transcriptional regulator
MHSRPGSNRTTTLQQKAYHLIKQKIMNRELKPGSYLADGRFASELGMSRTPVREAFRLLEYEGFLISSARRGWQVYSLSLKDIQEIFDIKENLESLLARKAAACEDNAKRGQLKRAIERMKASAAANNYDAWRQADLDLHDILLAMSGNGRASRIIRDLNDQWYRIRLGWVAMQSRVECSNREHEAVVEQILARDGVAAERQMRNHLHNLRVELERLLVNMVLPFVETGV